MLIPQVYISSKKYYVLTSLRILLCLFILFISTIAVFAQVEEQTHTTFLPMVMNGTTNGPIQSVEPQQQRTAVASSSSNGEDSPLLQEIVYMLGPSTIINAGANLTDQISQHCATELSSPAWDFSLINNSLQRLPDEEPQRSIGIYVVTIPEGNAIEDVIAWINDACIDIPWPLHAVLDPNEFGIELPEPTKGYTDGVVLVIGREELIDGHLVNHVVDLCGSALPTPQLHLSLLHAPIRLWDPHDDEAGETSEDRQAIGIYAITTQIDSDIETPVATVEMVVEWINQPCTTSFLKSEPNYRVSLLQGWSIGESPWTATTAISETYASFETQWALTTIGVRTQAGNQISPVPSHEGENVYVGVFDTLPFTKTEPISANPNNGIPYHMTLQVDTSAIKVSNISSFAAYKNQVCASQEHGMNVASLVSVVAPKSKLMAYKVMNDCGEGSLDTVFPALDRFIQLVNSKQNQRGVINMSFGRIGEPPADARYSQNQQSSITLKELLDFANTSGIVNVAAAGNESWKREQTLIGGPVVFQYNNRAYDAFSSRSTPTSAMYPASYSSVIAVAATSDEQSNERACYSHRADSGLDGIAAPGGGIPANDTGHCNPRYFLERYCHLGTKHCLIGMNSDGTFSYIAGTSFAAPFVTGIAALIQGERLALSRPNPPGSSSTCRLNPQRDVYDNPLSTTDIYLGNGIVHYNPPHCSMPPPN